MTLSDAVRKGEKMSSEFDVLVVGYGPVGQTLALLLGGRGLKVGVVERFSSLYNLPRAVHFDHEVGRIFQSAGIAEQVRAVSVANEATVFKYLNAKREILTQILLGGESQSGWPYASGFAQQQLECVIDEAVRKQPTVTLLAGWECVGIEQSSDHVEVIARQRNGDETQRLSASYMVGADGANSIVRAQMQVPVTDLGFNSTWLVVSVLYKSDDAPRPGMVQICDPARSITVAPGGINRQRFEFMLVGDETPDQMQRPEAAWKLLAEFGLTTENVVLERHAVYTFNARWAEQWQKGRLFIAGDAAHVMPPFRAQGLCSGIRDAAALAWRFSLVLAGQAPESLLESYGTERLPHVIEWIHQAVEIGKVICISDPDAAAKRDAFMLAVAADPSIAPPRPPPPRLGRGITRDGDPHAGKLGFQGRVAVSGREGLFDDLVGGGFSLVGTTIDPAAFLSSRNRAWLDRLGTTISQVTNDGAVRDVTGGYAAFFDDLGVGVILCRPDFHIFGTAREGGDVNMLVDELRAKLGGSPATDAVNMDNQSTTRARA